MTPLWNLTVWSQLKDISRAQREEPKWPLSRERHISFLVNTLFQSKTSTKLILKAYISSLNSSNKHRVRMHCSRVIFILGKVMSTLNIGSHRIILKLTLEILCRLRKLKWSRIETSKALYSKGQLIRAPWLLTTLYSTGLRLRAEIIMIRIKL